MQNPLKYILLSLFCIAVVACVQPYNVDVYSAKDYLLVDGTITNLDETQSISISRTNPEVKYTSSDFTSKISPPKNALIPFARGKVYVLVNGTDLVKFTETTDGVYESPKGFKGKVDNSYQLKIEAANGTRYESSAETMLPVAPIKAVSNVFNAKGVQRLSLYGEYTPTSDIYVDFDDPISEKNFYRWRSVDYETVRFCETCNQAKYYQYDTETGHTGDCFRDLTLAANLKYDYTCESGCWDKLPSNDIVIFSDAYPTGQVQKSKLVTQVPLYQSNGALISIQQMSMTVSAYRYFKLLQDQSVATGTLADTPPAPIRSNISNVNAPDELVLGFFTASAVDDNRYWLDRKNTKGGDLNGYFKFFNNRPVNMEATSFDRQKIPLALCKITQTRTPFVPAGWRF